MATQQNFLLKKHAVTLKTYADHPRLQNPPAKRLTDDERIAAKNKRRNIVDVVERWKQEGTEHAAAAILVFAAAAAATTAAQQWPRLSTRAGSGPTSILDLGYLGKNIIITKDAVQANLPNLGPSNTFICDANGGMSKATVKTQVYWPGLPPEAGAPRGRQWYHRSTNTTLTNRV